MPPTNNQVVTRRKLILGPKIEVSINRIKIKEMMIEVQVVLRSQPKEDFAVSRKKNLIKGGRTQPSA